MMASSSCLNFNSDEKCLAFSGYAFKDGALTKLTTPSGRMPYEVEYVQNPVSFKASFKSNEFVYFLYNIEGGKSKLGKICTNNAKSKTNSYEDTPIICSYNGQNYTVAQDVVHWKADDEKSWIFVAFSDISSSVICRYELADIKVIFHESRKQRLKCPNVEQNIYFKNQRLGDWCFNLSPLENVKVNKRKLK
ncbi:unnamed protein product [Mytilus edulis]|uniref:Sema domain-containing protein n=1 Tax=Mytilus edulis TaxID=6550 RepID=A0A8S3SM42_MYTED|nr:unnamed protein product [Mytilus edulis]